MPLSERDLIDVARLARIFADAEMLTLERVLSALARGVDDPAWEIDVLARLQRLTAQTLDDLGSDAAQYVAAIRERLAALYASGEAAIFAEIGAAGIDRPEAIEDGRRRAVVLALAREMNDAASAAGRGMLRAVDDVYRRIVGETVELVASRGLSRRDALRTATRTFLSRGIPSFTDESGRRWSIQSYVDMATRTGYANAQIRGHEDALTAARLDLCIVQPGPRACDICDEWARKVLARNGRAGTITTTNRLTGKPMQVKVDGTLAEARAAGFQHPNCRCSLRAFIPGATEKATIQRPPWDGEGYQRQQQQRGIERAIREAKTQALVAESVGDTKTAERARARVKAAQQRLRDHLAANPELKRRNDREQVIR